MRATLYVDKGRPFVTVAEETLTDGSKVWDIQFRGGDTFHCVDEKKADQAFQFIAAAVRIAHGSENILIL